MFHFFSKKLDQYRNKEIKIEIALTLEKSSHKQLEIHFENYKKEVAEKQTQYNKKIEVRYSFFFVTYCQLP